MTVESVSSPSIS